MPGYQWQKVEFGDPKRVPKSLYIVMHKEVPAVEPSPIGEFEISAAGRHRFNPALQTVVLELMADGKVTAITTLADNKTKVTVKGTWKQSDNPLPRRVNCWIRNKDDLPDPAKVCRTPLEFILSPEGDALIPASGGPRFYRVR